MSNEEIAGAGEKRKGGRTDCRLGLINLLKLYDTHSFTAVTLVQDLRLLHVPGCLKQLYKVLIGSRPRQL